MEENDNLKGDQRSTLVWEDPWPPLRLGSGFGFGLGLVKNITMNFLTEQPSRDPPRQEKAPDSEMSQGFKVPGG